MARVNIEEEAWKRIYRLAEVADCSVREAAGTVACLWSQSQDFVRIDGSRDEIIEWASLFKISDEEVEKFILGLEKARFISITENGRFRIHGNESQLESLASKINRASKGGKALQKKMKELKRLKAGLKQSTSLLQEAPRGSMQCNSMQGNAVQFNANQSNAIQDSSSTVLDEAKPAKKTSMTKEISFSNDSDLWTAIPVDTKARWLRLYDEPEFITKEIIKAFTYYETNARKRPKTLKGWINALSSWFERGWTKHVVKIKPEQKNQDMFSKIKYGDEAS